MIAANICAPNVPPLRWRVRRLGDISSGRPVARLEVPALAGLAKQFEPLAGDRMPVGIGVRDRKGDDAPAADFSRSPGAALVRCSITASLRFGTGPRASMRS